MRLPRLPIDSRRVPGLSLVRRLLNISLLGRFAVFSVVPMVGLGIVLGITLGGTIRDRNLESARRSAQLVARLTVQPHITADDLTDGLSPDEVRTLDIDLRSGLRTAGVARLQIWNTRGVIIYSDDHSSIGKSFPDDDNLQAALGGQVVSELSSDEDANDSRPTGFGQLLEVYIPIRFLPDTPPDGAVELYLPYQPIAAQIQQDSLRLYLILAAGLGILYAALFRIVAGGSRTLQRQAAELKRQAQEREFQALHDPLTQLPNRSLFYDRVGQAIKMATREQRQAAVMIMDLDHFKEINDTLGHQNGDQVLCEIGKRLPTVLRQSDTIARLGGDEFGVLLPSVSGRQGAEQVAAKLLEALEKPFVVNGLPLDVHGSIGIAMLGEHGNDATILVQRADVAMYQAKESHSGYALYRAEQDPYAPSRLELMGQLHGAISNGELVLHYQPKISLRTGEVDGVEALVRWMHPQRGLIPPDQFVPLAEHSGVIRDLTLHVLRLAMSQYRSWFKEGLELAVAVNLSMRNLQDSQFAEDVDRLLNEYQMPPAWLGLEITESSIMADPESVKKVLSKLSARGIRLAVDDFGTGYSSLAYLKHLPVTELKIDRSFIGSISTDGSDMAIVRSIVDLGRNLDLKVVAEGVETKDGMDKLRSLGCELAQGFYIGRPMPGNEVEGWVERWKSRTERLAA